MKNDFIITLAWPEGMVACTDAWYDKFFSSNGKYRVGHAAVVIVERVSGKLLFFDFGRYHSPKGFGRVRDVETDHDVAISSLAEIKDNNIVNLKEILKDIKGNTSFHGEGTLYASILSNISFQKAYKYAKNIQDKGFTLYGPLIYNGTNCSRFVASVMRSSGTNFVKRLRLKFPFCLSPSPKRNVAIAHASFYKIGVDSFKEIKRNMLQAYFKSIERS